MKFGLALWLTVFSAIGWSTDTDHVVDKNLVSKLHAGGYTLYFRHAQTDWSQGDIVEKRGDWTSCDTTRVRQLSEEGRQTAMAVGQAMRKLGIPIGRVFSSPYCRAVETARLMEIGPIEITTDVMNLRVAEYFDSREAIVVRARLLISTLPEPGTNTVIVAHGNVAKEATPVYPSEAEAIVFHPHGNGSFSLVGRITPSQWDDLGI